MRVTWGWAPTRSSDHALHDHADAPVVRRTTARRSASPSDHHSHHPSHREGTTHHV